MMRNLDWTALESERWRPASATLFRPDDRSDPCSIVQTQTARVRAVCAFSMRLAAAAPARYSFNSKTASISTGMLSGNVAAPTAERA